MKLSLEQIKNITQGTAYIDEVDGWINFHRFTKEQEEVYKGTAFEGKTHSSSNMRLEFETDSTRFYIKLRTAAASSRRYFMYELYSDGNMIGKITNVSDDSTPDISAEYPLGEFEGDFALGSGMKMIQLIFPWSVSTEISEISVDDGATVLPVKKNKKMLIFGDSITQGYDSFFPSRAYAVRIADALGAEALNKAIGGEVYNPALSKAKDDFCPDIITISYGSNDWAKRLKTDFERDCAEFYKTIAELYPGVKIFAFTPIWRKDIDKETDFDNFSDVTDYIIKTVSKYDNITPIIAYDFVPKDEQYFADLRLHPNDKGFDCLADNLIEKLQQYV